MPKHLFSTTETQQQDQKNQDAYNQTKARFFEAQKRDIDAPKLNKAYERTQKKACDTAYANELEKFLFHSALDNPIPYPEKDNIPQCVRRK